MLRLKRLVQVRTAAEGRSLTTEEGTAAAESKDAAVPPEGVGESSVPAGFSP
jgi:hypothetical protein